MHWQLFLSDLYSFNQDFCTSSILDFWVQTRWIHFSEMHTHQSDAYTSVRCIHICSNLDMINSHRKYFNLKSSKIQGKKKIHAWEENYSVLVYRLSFCCHGIWAYPKSSLSSAANIWWEFMFLFGFCFFLSSNRIWYPTHTLHFCHLAFFNSVSGLVCLLSCFS